MRRARLAAGFDLDQLARHTRISHANLEALDSDRFDLLPGRAYVRGFYRVVAAELGADPGPWLAALDRELPEGDRASGAGGPVSWFQRPLMSDSLNVPVRIGHVLAVLLGILTFFLLYFALEGRGVVDETTASSQDGTLLEMLDTRPIQRR